MRKYLKRSTGSTMTSLVSFLNLFSLIGSLVFIIDMSGVL